MGLGLSRTDWMSIAAVTGIAALLSLAMLIYLWVYQQPSLEALSKLQVSVINGRDVTWMKRGSRRLEYVELFATPTGSREKLRFVLSQPPEGLSEALVQAGGQALFWFDPRQANEVFQIQAGDSLVLKYEDVYGFKSRGADSWWRGSWYIFLSALLVAVFAAFRIKNMNIGQETR